MVEQREGPGTVLEVQPLLEQLVLGSSVHQHAQWESEELGEPIRWLVRLAWFGGCEPRLTHLPKI